MQASQALYTAMLPYRLPLRAQDIPPGAYPFTQATGCTLFPIALEIFIYFPLFCFPFIMIACTELPEQLPCFVMFPLLDGTGYFLQLPLCQPCPDIYPPICSYISQGNVVGHQPYIPCSMYLPILFLQYLFRIHKRPAPIRNATGNYGKDIRRFRYRELQSIALYTIPIGQHHL